MQAKQGSAGRAQGTANPGEWQEQIITAPGPCGALEGSWVQPVAAVVAPPPLALILPGSGPTDRHGNGPHLQTDSYRLLAQGLAQAGIASVRVDKRGMFGSQAAVPDANAVVMTDYVSDVTQWTQVLQPHTQPHGLWLIGHSEGGLVALLAAQHLGPAVAGIILLSTPGRRMGAVLRQQLQAQLALVEVLPQALEIIKQLEAGTHVPMETIPAPLQPLFAAPVQGFLMDLLQVDPQALLSGYDGPVLILQGTQDQQVPADDARQLQKAQPHAVRQWLPGATHTLKCSTGPDPVAQQATYQDSSLPLHPDLVPHISRFMQQHAVVRPGERG